MRRALLLFLCLALPLAACGRPLSPHETAFLSAMQGSDTDLGRVRIHKGLPLPAEVTSRPDPRRRTCQARLFPPPKQSVYHGKPAAMTILSTIHLRDDYYQPDLLPDYPARVYLPDAMLLAHEMVHVWQWQNRARTGYTPFRAMMEHAGGADPYLFEPETKTAFLDHGYEQQGAIVEEYLCCRTLAPKAARTQRLRAMLAEAFPNADLDAKPAQAVILPWDGVKVAGICD